MRNLVIGCVVLFAMAGSALSETQEPPKGLAVDLGGGVKLDLVSIPAGSFTMGDASYKSAHKVTITKPFHLGKYEVTQEQWKAVMGDNPSRFKSPRNPVESVSWDDCQQFLIKLNAKAGGQGGKFVLPTEAQWEYACRAGSTGKFCFGDDEARLGDYAWCSSSSDDKPHSVGEKKPNAFGLYDMHGNVWEWCQDWYGKYDVKAVDDPIGPTTGSGHVIRGGGWDIYAGDCRSADRGAFTPGYRFRDLGFRVSRVPVDTVAETSPPDSAVSLKVQPISPGTTVQATDRNAVLPDQSKKPSEPSKELTVDLDKGVTLELVLIPAGEFLMGSSESDRDADREKPQHKVRITKPFYLGKYLVTQEQWKAVMGDNPSEFKGPKNPVEQVRWDDCQKFLLKLNAKTGGQGGKFVLPTEAQWEYACREGSTGKFCFGDDEKQLGEYAWYRYNSGDKTHGVGEKKPNAWGLYDMHGNVWEWCADWYGAYGAEAADDPSGPTTGPYRVSRGGSWFDVGRFCQSAFRNYFGPGFRYNFLGLRVARVPADK